MALSAILIGLAATVPGQTAERRSHIPTPQASDGPFGTQWAKPSGTAGGYIYNDPRLRDPYSASRARSTTRCPAPLLYDPRSNRCQ
jgi:hypothetical protein